MELQKVKNFSLYKEDETLNNLIIALEKRLDDDKNRPSEYNSPSDMVSDFAISDFALAVTERIFDHCRDEYDELFFFDMK